MSTPLERFRQRQLLLESAAARPAVVLLPSAEQLAELARMPIDDAYVNAPRFAGASMAVPAPFADDSVMLLARLESGFAQRKFTVTISGMRRAILHSIATPFGVGKFISAMDRAGGNVDTVVNARKGIYATTEEARRYQERDAYDERPYHRHKEYIGTNAAMSAQLKAGQTVQDAYRDVPITAGDRHHPQLKPSLDHIRSAKEIHDDPGVTLAGLHGPDVANVPENLAHTAKTVNSSKRADKASDFVARRDARADVRRTRLTELEKDRDAWTARERAEHTKLNAQEQVDERRVTALDEHARTEIGRRINEAYYGSDKFRRRLATTSVTEGAKMGLQQVLGIVLVEFFAGVMDEVSDLWRAGCAPGSIVREARTRLRRVARRVAATHTTLMAAFGQGFVSGLLSNLVTTLINAFITTGKRMVRMIREGIFSLSRAAALLVARPSGMTKREALHAASQLAVAAGVTMAGIALEEALSAQLLALGIGGAVIDAATTALVGALTAIAVAFSAHLVNQADAFGVQAVARDTEIIASLKAQVAETQSQIDARYATMAAQHGL